MANAARYLIAASLIRGTTLVIDELDAKIHSVLLRHIVMLYNDMSIGVLMNIPKQEQFNERLSGFPLFMRKDFARALGTR